MDSKTFAIGVLSTTAVVLLAALMVVYALPDQVHASGMTATGGSFTITVGMGASGNEELLYVIDSGTGRLITYRFDGGSGQIVMLHGLELGQLGQGDQGASPGQGRRRP